MGPPSSKKRKLPAAPGPEPKRSKTKKPVAAASKKAKSDPKKPSGRIVDVASLAWQTVGEEDFGGLQVITGVNVVKYAQGVQFVVSDDAEQKQKQRNPADESESNNNVSEEEPFEGFGDDPVAGQHIDTGEAGHPPDDAEGAQRGPATQGKTAKNKSRQDDKQHQQLEAKTTKKKANSHPTEDALLQKSAAHKARGGNSQNAFEALNGAEEDGDGGVDVAAWVALNLSPRILSAIAKLGFTKPTIIQKRAIPQIVAGVDVIGKAQTGSGKTLAFGIPIVEKWLEKYDGNEEEGSAQKKTKGPMAVVLSPTRELAKQLGDHLKALCDGLPSAPYICVVTGGLSIQKQQRQLEKADIVIGTPGRLWEVMDGDIKLQDALTRIDFLVVDEADRLFKAGQFKEAENIIGALDRRDPEAGGSDHDSEQDEDGEQSHRQTLVFSATFDKDLQTKLAGKGKKAFASGNDEEKMAYLMKCLKFRGEPKFIDVNPVSQMAEGLKEGLIECGAMEKDLFLYTVLLLNPGRRTLVFTNSISAVRRLTPLLQHLQLPLVLPLHSQMAQKARLRSLERFAAQRNAVLVATDVAARGLDIHEVDQVVHYHVPRAADTYIHRSGRTARGDRSGVSVILCSPDEVIPTRRLAAKVHAERSSSKAKQHLIQMLPVDRKIATRLKPRVDLAKRIADAVLAKEKGHSEDQWLRNAADELGVEYDSDDFEGQQNALGRGGRGGGRRRKEKEARALSKAEMGALKAQLREELSRRVNLGVSERYITGGRVDVAALLRERDTMTGGIFLGGDNLGLGL
ncbi:RNA helicase [Purpureocillium takamizusanense]|uniref:ATP-dependent RNA helicase n=1 Tax=Purpureocillium takamizusanense TaxID=2060973 RepID=A0A9Q8QEH6_9HYPO|nr:RNA helicase [Purpureocillium takamizusanense]UNI18028.1 RNA helicase [Purpureocillium takamizusanense]